DQERRLEDVLGVLLVAEQAPAEREHTGAVPPHHRGEGRLVALGQELPEQFAVRRASTRLRGGQPGQVPQQDADPFGGHGERSPGRRGLSLIVPRSGRQRITISRKVKKPGFSEKPGFGGVILYHRRSAPLPARKLERFLDSRRLCLHY